MSRRDLAHSLEHLEAHRRLILGRSIALALASLVPVPLLDDWLAAVIRRETIRRIAEERRVDLDPEAVKAIADGKVTPPSWHSLLGSLAIAGALRRTLRKVFVAVTLVRRADDIARSFAVATLFDHYCARLHVGAGLDAARGRAVRAAIDGAIGSVRTGVGGRLVRRGLLVGARAAVRAPFEAADALSGGVLRRLLGRRDEQQAAEAVEEAVVHASRPGGFVARAAQAAHAQLGVAGRSWIGDLVAAFERRMEGEPHGRA